MVCVTVVTLSTFMDYFVEVTHVTKYAVFLIPLKYPG